MNLGLALVAVLLWQGSFAQPQLDGRYGVDRVAMAQEAKEAAKPPKSNNHSVKPDKSWICPVPCGYDEVILDHDVPTSVFYRNLVLPSGCEFRTDKNGRMKGSPQCFPEKPSPQITAVRAVRKPIREKLDEKYHMCSAGFYLVSQLKGGLMCEKDAYKCPANHILLHSQDGSEHWCLKIEEAK